MATFNEELLDAMIRHQVGLLQFSGHVRRRVWQLLDATEADLRRQIKRYGPKASLDAPAGLRRLEGLLERLRASRLKGWRNARAAWFEEMHGLARAEPGFFDRVLVSIFPVELGTVLPDAARLRDIVTSRPFMGKTLKGWADSIQREDINRIESAIKIGLAQGESIPQLSRRVVGSVRLNGRDGVTQITRRGAATITRTVSNGIAAEARRAYMEANADLVGEELFTATLDSRTTPICRSLDGTRHKVGEGPRLPLHMGERSLRSPIVDGKVIGDRPRRDFTERSLLREYAAENNLDRVPLKRTQLPRGTKGAYDAFARRRMRELTGTTPATTTYGSWLKRQNAAFQDDILGDARGALFRRGGLTLDRFVETDGSVITLAELADRHADAFLRANLDPSAFR